MVIFIYFLLLALGLVAYKVKKYSSYIIISFLIISNGAGFLPEPLPIKVNDVFLMLCIGTWFIKYRAFPLDDAGRYIKYLTIYYILSSLITILLGFENSQYALMVLRLEIYILAYFLFKTLPFVSIEHSARGIFLISLITGIFYYLQFLGITGILQNGDKEVTGITTRLNNIPLCTDFIIYYLVYTSKKVHFKWFYLLFFIGMVLMSQNRGQWLAVGLCVSIILIYKRQAKKIIYGALFLTITIYIFLPVILYRFSEGGKTGSDLLTEISGCYNILVNGGSQYYSQGASVMYTEGTSMFRALLVRERIDYMLNNPITIFCGIGSIHEMSSSAAKLPFMMGNLWENGNVKKIDTNDLAFFSHFVRYGLIYIVLFFKFLVVSLKQLLRNHKSELFFCCFMLLLDSLIQTFNGDRFSGVNMMFIPLLLISQAFKQD